MKQRNATLDAKAVIDAITALKAANPELEDDEVLRSDMVEGATDAFEFVSLLLRNIGASQALMAGNATYIAALREYQARLERREASLRTLIVKVMNAADLTRVERPEGAVTIKKGSPKVVIIDEAALPLSYLRLKTEPDRVKIRAALTAEPPIAVSGATLSNAEPVLAISPHVKPHRERNNGQE